jgi:competence protein ComEC
MVIQFLKRLPVTPVLCAALGTVIGFYILFHAALPVTAAVLLLFTAAFNFLMVLSSLDTQSRALKLYSVCAAALIVGIVLGVCAANAGQNKTVFGFPENKITGIEGVLLEDPRIISGGKAIVSVSLRKCAAGSTLRAVGSGEITIFFSQESAEKLKHFGRGTVIFAEGSLRSNERGNVGRSWSVSAKSLHIVEPPPPIERMRTGVRLSLIKRFSGKPWGGLALALLLGIKDNLDTELAVMYRNAGLSYILALS